MEKDALAVKWVVPRLRNYQIGSPKFTIITTHKPFIPMFNKVKPRLLSLVEKRITEKTYFNFELKCEPGRNELDPLDYMSVHPTSENHYENIKQVINHISPKKTLKF